MSTVAARDALEAAYRTDARRVLATLIRLLGRFDAAEEALHDAFAAAVEQWPCEGVPANPYAWLVSTGRFRSMDRYRRQARLDGALQEHGTLTRSRPFATRARFAGVALILASGGCAHRPPPRPAIVVASLAPPETHTSTPPAGSSSPPPSDAPAGLQAFDEMRFLGGRLVAFGDSSHWTLLDEDTGARLGTMRRADIWASADGCTVSGYGSSVREIVTIHPRGDACATSSAAPPGIARRVPLARLSSGAPASAGLALVRGEPPVPLANLSTAAGLGVLTGNPGVLVAVATGRRLGFWDVPSGRLITHIPIRRCETSNIEISPDGAWVMLDDGERCTTLVDVGRHAVARRFAGSPYEPRFSADGHAIAVNGPRDDRELTVYAVGTWRPIRRFRYRWPTRAEVGMAERDEWSPRQQSVLLGSITDDGHVMDLWIAAVTHFEPRDDTELTRNTVVSYYDGVPTVVTRDAGRPAPGVAAAPDGIHAIVQGNNGPAVLFRLDGAAPPQALGSEFRGDMTGGDGRFLVANPDGVGMYEWHTTTPVLLWHLQWAAHR